MCKLEKYWYTSTNDSTIIQSFSRDHDLNFPNQLGACWVKINIIWCMKIIGTTKFLYCWPFFKWENRSRCDKKWMHYECRHCFDYEHALSAIRVSSVSSCLPWRHVLSEIIHWTDIDAAVTSPDTYSDSYCCSCVSVAIIVSRDRVATSMLWEFFSCRWW